MNEHLSALGQNVREDARCKEGLDSRLGKALNMMLEGTLAYYFNIKNINIYIYI